jgi:colanic acid/amylovoran biosynthesis glycosyltransferase
LLQKTYDIFQCHYAHSGLLGVHLKKLGCRGKIVTMFHGYDIRAGIAHNGSCYKDLWQHGDCFLSISQYTSEHIIRFGADPLRVVRHPVGIDTTRFPFRSAAIREKKDPARTRFVSVARLVPEKGLSYALKAIKILLTDHPDQAVEYRIIGEGPLRRDLQHQVDELGLTNIVTFLGGVTQSVVREELSSADIFLLPSIAEVLPIALMEAQSTGLPVIATDVGGVREIVLDNRSGYVIPSGNPVILADCLGKIVVQRGCWGEMGKMGSAYIAENFDMKNLNRRLENIYIGLAHDRVPCDLGEK